MKTFLQPVAVNEVSYRGAVLHQALEQLGHPVTAGEVKKRQAGLDTKAQVRALQKQLGIPSTEKTLVDSTTAAALEDQLQKTGSLDSKDSFTVTGTVRLQDDIRRQQPLLAFDLDLKGVAKYHTSGSIGELEATGPKTLAQVE